MRMEALLGTAFTAFLLYVFVITPAMDYGQEKAEKKARDDAWKKWDKETDHRPVYTCRRIDGPTYRQLKKEQQEWLERDLAQFDAEDALAQPGPSTSA